MWVIARCGGPGEPGLGYAPVEAARRGHLGPAPARRHTVARAGAGPGRRRPAHRLRAERAGEPDPGPPASLQPGAEPGRASVGAPPRRPAEPPRARRRPRGRGGRGGSAAWDALLAEPGRLRSPSSSP